MRQTNKIGRMSSEHCNNIHLHKTFSMYKNIHFPLSVLKSIFLYLFYFDVLSLYTSHSIFSFLKTFVLFTSLFVLHSITTSNSLFVKNTRSINRLLVVMSENPDCCSAQLILLPLFVFSHCDLALSTASGDKCCSLVIH